MSCLSTLLKTSCVLLATLASLSSQRMTVVKHWKRTSTAEYIDCWGYRHPATGREFAIVAEQKGIWIVETTDPTKIVESAYFTAPLTQWRDFETYGNYIYAISENHRGFRIIDMTNPSAPKDLGLKLTAYHRSAHNMSIDPDTGMLYVCGAMTSGMYIYNAKAKPEEPVPLTLGGTDYIHDVCIRRNRAYLSVGYVNKLRIVDVTNVKSFKKISEFKTPGSFTHNSWVTEDDKLLAVTDEYTYQSNPPHMSLWDISDASKPVQKGAYIVPGHGVHYAFTMGRTAYLSHYGDGVHVVDIADPTNPRMLARYDTSTYSGIRGCWGIYPFTDSGLIYASDMDNGLYILQADCGHLNRFGTATPGSNGKTPRIVLRGGSPKVDSPGLKFKFEGMLPNAKFILLIGVGPGNTDILGVKIHMNLQFVLLFHLQAGANGELLLPTPISDTPALAGGKLYFQIAATDSGMPGGFSASRGMWTGICPK